MNFTVPARRSRRPARTVATPIRMATWASWPQACMTPTFSPFQVVRAFDANGTSTRSSTGRRVHVGAQRDHRPGQLAAQHADDAGDARPRCAPRRSRARAGGRRRWPRCGPRGCRARGARAGRAARRSAGARPLRRRHRSRRRGGSRQCGWRARRLLGRWTDCLRPGDRPRPPRPGLGQRASVHSPGWLGRAP